MLQVIFLFNNINIIKRIVIGNGVNTIGTGAFKDLGKIDLIKPVWKLTHPSKVTSDPVTITLEGTDKHLDTTKYVYGDILERRVKQ